MRSFLVLIVCLFLFGCSSSEDALTLEDCDRIVDSNFNEFVGGVEYKPISGDEGLLIGRTYKNKDHTDAFHVVVFDTSSHAKQWHDRTAARIERMGLPGGFPCVVKGSAAFVLHDDSRMCFLEFKDRLK